MKMAMMYSPLIDSVLDQMQIIRRACYLPTILIADGKIISFEFTWSSDDARESFELLERRLKHLIDAQQRITLKENTQ